MIDVQLKKVKVEVERMRSCVAVDPVWVLGRHGDEVLLWDPDTETFAVGYGCEGVKHVEGDPFEEYHAFSHVVNYIHDQQAAFECWLDILKQAEGSGK